MGRIGTLYKLVTKANRFAAQRPNEVRRGIDRVARAADRATGGRYRSQIRRGARVATRYVERRR